MKNHLKRLAAHRNWDLLRKAGKFTARPNSGAHASEEACTLVYVVRDALGLAKTRKEVRDIIFNAGIEVDGRARKDHKFNVGLMDVIGFPSTKKYYRIVFNKQGKLAVIEIKDTEAKQKISRVSGKSQKAGKTILHLRDGRTVIGADAAIKVGDSVLLEVPDQKIVEHLPFGKGSSIVLVGGKHIGSIGTVEKVEGNVLIFKSNDGEVFETLKTHAYVVGKAKPAVTLQ